jgi:hypothetical protein
MKRGGQGSPNVARAGFGVRLHAQYDNARDTTNRYMAEVAQNPWVQAGVEVISHSVFYDPISIDISSDQDGRTLSDDDMAATETDRGAEYHESDSSNRAEATVTEQDRDTHASDTSQSNNAVAGEVQADAEDTSENEASDSQTATAVDAENSLQYHEPQRESENTFLAEESVDKGSDTITKTDQSEEVEEDSRVETDAIQDEFQPSANSESETSDTPVMTDTEEAVDLADDNETHSNAGDGSAINESVDDASEEATTTTKESGETMAIHDADVMSAAEDIDADDDFDSL